MVTIADKATSEVWRKVISRVNPDLVCIDWRPTHTKTRKMYVAELIEQRIRAPLTYNIGLILKIGSPKWINRWRYLIYSPFTSMFHPDGIIEVFYENPEATIIANKHIVYDSSRIGSKITYSTMQEAKNEVVQTAVALLNLPLQLKVYA